MNMLYVARLVGEDMGAESRVTSIKVRQLNDKLLSRGQYRYIPTTKIFFVFKRWS
jgi:hypothetical protein